MRWFVMLCSLVLMTLVPGSRLLYTASAQDEATDQGWQQPSGDYPDDTYGDEDPGQYQPEDAAPDDQPMDDPSFDEAPVDPQDEVPPQE